MKNRGGTAAALEIARHSIVKILFFVVLSAFFVVLLECNECFGETYVDTQGITWEYELSERDSEVTITGLGYTGFYRNLDIPSSIQEKPVTRIGENAFQKRSGIVNVVIPEGVREIETGAFSFCIDLENVELPESLKTLGQSAFMKTGLTTILIPEGVSSVGNGCFWGTELSDAHFRLPDSIHTIPMKLFGNCLSLKHYEVQDGIYSIGKSAFESCINMQDVYISPEVESIGSDVFLRAGSNLPSGDAFCICGEANSFAETYALDNGILFSVETREEYKQRVEKGEKAQESTVIVETDENGNGTYTDAEGVKWSFRLEDESNRVAMITDSEGVRPDGVLTVPSEIGQYSIDHIRGLASKDRNNIKTIIIENGIRRIGFASLSDCINLKEIVIPETLKTVEEAAFMNCESLKLFSVDPNNPCIRFEDGVLYDIEDQYVVGYASGQKRDDLILPEGSTGMINCAFAQAGLRHVSFPSTMKSIGEQAFVACRLLKRVHFSSGLKEIKSGAFFTCDNLPYAELPDGVEIIGEKAFCCCFNMRGIYIPKSVQTMGKDVFKSTGTKIEGDIPFTIYGEEGSFAETYANENSIRFVPANREQYRKAMGIEEDSNDEQSKLPDLKEPATQVIIGSKSFKTKTGSKGIMLGMKAMTPLTYRSSDKTVATVDVNGKVHIKGPGTAKITVVAEGNDEYLPTSKVVIIDVEFERPKMTAKKKGRKVKITWGKVIGADGYKLYIKGPGEKKFKCRLTKSARVKSVTHRGLAKGKKYRYKIRAYKKVGGKILYSPYSKTRTVKI